MVTGIEAISLTLAIIPLMLNQLDNYAQGLQTLKLFRTRRYREHLESCAAMLGGQHAILFNTMGLVLGDSSTVEFRDLISSSDGRPWRNPRLDDILRTRIGNTYDAFAAMMGQASKLLEELSSRLRLEASNPSAVGSYLISQIPKSFRLNNRATNC